MNLLIVVICRGVGCVLFEMASGKPLFPGSAIDNQLELIFRTLGTPTELDWPGVTSHKSFETFKFTTYKPDCLVISAPRYFGYCEIILKQDVRDNWRAMWNHLIGVNKVIHSFLSTISTVVL